MAALLQYTFCSVNVLESFFLIGGFALKAEPIMLLVLATYYSFQNFPKFLLIFALSVIMMSTIHMVVGKWVHLMWLTLTISKYLLFLKKWHCSFYIHYLFNIWHNIIIFSHLISQWFFYYAQKHPIILRNILLFQHYSHQICNLLYSILCQHNRLRPICTANPPTFTLWISCAAIQES